MIATNFVGPFRRDRRGWVPLWLGLVLVGLGGGAPFLGAEEATETGKAPTEALSAGRQQSLALLERVAWAGASQTIGFGINKPLGPIVHKGFPVVSPPIVVADSFFFAAPRRSGRRQMDRVLAERPTLLYAVDYLFWYAYGARPAEDRLPFLREGLAQLDRYEGPIFVGDLPDMRGASELLLPSHCVPEPSVLEDLNREIRKWIAERPRVTAIPLSQWVRRVKAGEPLEVAGETYTHTAEELLMGDRLHANYRGQLLLALLCLEKTQRALPALGAEDFVLTYEALKAAAEGRGAKRAAEE